jgi:hypothetical protein
MRKSTARAIWRQHKAGTPPAFRHLTGVKVNRSLKFLSNPQNEPTGRGDDMPKTKI